MGDAAKLCEILAKNSQVFYITQEGSLVTQEASNNKGALAQPADDVVA